MSSQENKPATPKCDIGLVWKLYESHVGLFKHFLELMVKFNVFYYAVTGAIFSFYLSRAPSLATPPEAALLGPLALIVVISLVFGAFLIYASTRVQYMHQATKRYQLLVDEHADPTATKFIATPEMGVLQWAILGSAILQLIVALGTAGFICYVLRSN